MKPCLSAGSPEEQCPKQIGHFPSSQVGPQCIPGTQAVPPPLLCGAKIQALTTCPPPTKRLYTQLCLELPRTQSFSKQQWRRMQSEVIWSILCARGKNLHKGEWMFTPIILTQMLKAGQKIEKLLSAKFRLPAGVEGHKSGVSQQSSGLTYA